MYTARVMIGGIVLSFLVFAGGCGKKAAPVTPGEPPATQPSQEKDRQTLPPQ